MRANQEKIEGSLARLRATLAARCAPTVASLQLVSADGAVVASLTLREGENVFRVTKDGAAIWVRNNQS